jgi:hypothetical protein
MVYGSVFLSLRTADLPPSSIIFCNSDSRIIARPPILVAEA